MTEKKTLVQDLPSKVRESKENNPIVSNEDREQARRVKLLKAEVSIGQLASEVSQSSGQLDGVRQKVQEIESSMNQARRGLDEVSQLISFFEAQTQAAMTAASQEAVKALSDVVEEIGQVGQDLEQASERLLSARDEMDSKPQQISESLQSELIQQEDRNADRLEAVRQAMASNSKWTVEILDNQLSRLSSLTKWALVFSVSSLIGVTALLVYLLIR